MGFTYNGSLPPGEEAHWVRIEREILLLDFTPLSASEGILNKRRAGGVCLKSASKPPPDGQAVQQESRLLKKYRRQSTRTSDRIANLSFADGKFQLAGNNAPHELRTPGSNALSFIRASRMSLSILVLFFTALSPAVVRAADEQMRADLYEQVVRVPMRVKGLFSVKEVNLTATTYRPHGDGPFPLVVLSHGTPPRPADRVKIGRFRRIPQIREFINRGFAVIVPMRRGHGESGGDYAEEIGSCKTPAYDDAGRESARDVLAACDVAAKLPFVDPECILLVGQSTGGFASLAAASLTPSGVIGVVNFSGGKGGNPFTRPGEPCEPSSLAATIAAFSRTIKVPVLWHYVENDRFFSPRYIREWFAAFEQAGGKGRLVIQPPFGDDGHALFNSMDGIPIWTREFDSFMRDFKIGAGGCRIQIGR